MPSALNRSCIPGAAEAAARSTRFDLSFRTMRGNPRSSASVANFDIQAGSTPASALSCQLSGRVGEWRPDWNIAT